MRRILQQVLIIVLALIVFGSLVFGGYTIFSNGDYKVVWKDLNITQSLVKDGYFTTEIEYSAPVAGSYRRSRVILDSWQFRTDGTTMYFWVTGKLTTDEETPTDESKKLSVKIPVPADIDQVFYISKGDVDRPVYYNTHE